jgi:hypothetical protein
VYDAETEQQSSVLKCALLPCPGKREVESNVKGIFIARGCASQIHPLRPTCKLAGLHKCGNHPPEHPVKW